MFTFYPILKGSRQHPKEQDKLGQNMHSTIPLGQRFAAIPLLRKVWALKKQHNSVLHFKNSMKFYVNYKHQESSAKHQSTLMKEYSFPQSSHKIAISIDLSSHDWPNTNFT